MAACMTLSVEGQLAKDSGKENHIGGLIGAEFLRITGTRVVLLRVFVPSW